MKRYMIDYKLPDGRENWIGVDAESEQDAIRIFKNAGIDGWTGFNYADYEITAVTYRCTWED